MAADALDNVDYVCGISSSNNSVEKDRIHRQQLCLLLQSLLK